MNLHTKGLFIPPFIASFIYGTDDVPEIKFQLGEFFMHSLSYLPKERIQIEQQHHLRVAV